MAVAPVAMMAMVAVVAVMATTLSTGRAAAIIMNPVRRAVLGLVVVSAAVGVAMTVVLDEVDRLAASAVALAVLPPVSLMTVGHAQVDRALVNRHGGGLDDDGLRVVHGRRLLP